MKILPIIVFLSICFIALLARPNKLLDQSRMQERQEQQEEMVMEDEETDTQVFRVTYRSKNPAEDQVVDIIWLKKVADLALEKGMPYFNIIEQEIKLEKGVSVADGMVELDADPMKAEYNAHEIKALVVKDFTEQ